MKTRMKLLAIDLVLVLIYGVLPLWSLGVHLISIGCLFIGMIVHCLLAHKYAHRFESAGNTFYIEF